MNVSLRSLPQLIAISSMLVLIFASPGECIPETDHARPEQHDDQIIEIFHFEETPLRDVLRLISELTKKNVVATPTIQEIKISMYLRDVEPLLALEILCKNYNLWFTEQRNIIRVMKIEEYGRELTLRRDERTQVFNLKYASCFTVAEAIGNVFGTRVELLAPKEVESYGHVGTDRYPKIGEKLDEPDIERTLKEEDLRGPRDDRMRLGGLAMTESDLARLGHLLREGQEFSPDVLLERQIGQARALMTVFPRNNSVIVRSVDTNLLSDIAMLISQVDTPTREVLLEMKTLRISLEDGMESFFRLGLTPDARTSFSSMGSATLSAPSTFNFSFIDSKINADLRLLESQGRITELATPLVFVANNAAAKFFQGTETPVRTGYKVSEAQFNSDGVQISPAQVTTLYREEEVGVSLEVSPSINEDRTVTIKMLTEISSLNLGGGPPFDYSLSGQLIRGETDSVRKTVIEDIIVAMDGQTLVIGGLIEELDQDSESKVPLLGDIPCSVFSSARPRSRSRARRSSFWSRRAS